MTDYDSRDLEAAEMMARDTDCDDAAYDAAEARGEAEREERREAINWNFAPYDPPAYLELADEPLEGVEDVYPNGHFCHRLPECRGRSSCPRDIACTH